MIDLSTGYMGLTLKNPIIVGSSSLTSTTGQIKELEAAGAGAVVLKSIFEEQILMESRSLQSDHLAHTEEYDYIREYTRRHNLDNYLRLLEDTKKQVSIPVIASINCLSASGWTSFAAKLQDAGADALELNMFIMPADYRQRGEDIEQIYFDIIDAVYDQVSLPISVKIGFHFSGLANMIYNLAIRKISAMVLFNRFFHPDIDLEKMQIVSTGVHSAPEEFTLPLRWIGIMSSHVKCDLAASTGIHDGDTVMKNLLAGAKAVQVVSAIYKNKPKHIGVMLEQITNWMKKHNHSAVREIIGKLSRKNVKDPVMYERAQFMRYFSDAK
jgi:dihydroorotate dehydrogenase (fumarate)